MALRYFEAKDLLPKEEGCGAEDLGTPAKLFAVLGQKCRGGALAIFRGIKDFRGVSARPGLARKYNPKGIGGHFRRLERVVRPTHAKEVRQVEAALPLGARGIAGWRRLSRRLHDAG